VGNLFPFLYYVLGKLIPAVDTIAASLFPLSDDWLSAIRYLIFAAGAPWKWISYIFCLKLLKTIFRNLKD
jgi:hypothetical protein